MSFDLYFNWFIIPNDSCVERSRRSLRGRQVKSDSFTSDRYVEKVLGLRELSRLSKEHVVDPCIQHDED